MNKINLKNSSTLVTGMDPDKRKIISIISALTFDIHNNGMCVPDPEKSVITEDYNYYEGITYSGTVQPSLLKRDLDGHAWKKSTDLVVQGVARSNEEVRTFNIDLICKGKNYDMSRRINVFGDRWVEKSINGYCFSVPEKITEMPVRYDKAYGGTDEYAESVLIDKEKLAILKYMLGSEKNESSIFSYPRNPSGKGYAVLKERLNGLELPNLEFPNQRLSMDLLIAPQEQWGRRPYPACFDWFPHAWFPRIAFQMDTIDMDDGIPELEIKLGLVPENIVNSAIDKRPYYLFAQGAHPFLYQDRLVGDEKISLTHMSKNGDPLHLQLPDVSPVYEAVLYGKFLEKSTPVLDTVFIETEEERVTLVWRNSYRIGSVILKPDWEKECVWDVNVNV